MRFALRFTAVAQSPNGCDPGTPIPFNDNGAWGYATTSGVIIPPRFKFFPKPFFNGVAAACTSEGCGLINPKGEFVTALWSKGSGKFAAKCSEGLGAFVKDQKWGYMDSSGNIAIPPTFESAGDFESGMALVRLGDKSFYINHRGERITPDFDALSGFSEDLAAAIVAGKVGYIRRDGTFALPPVYGSTGGNDFREGLVAVRIAGKVGFMNGTGLVVIEPAFDDASSFSEGLAMVRMGDHWGYIKKTGKMAIPPIYAAAQVFGEGVAAVMIKGGKWGYIDHAGIFVIPPGFNAAMPFCAGLAPVETFRLLGVAPGTRTPQFEGRHGLIDHAGKYVWQDTVDRVWDSPVVH